MAPENGKGFEIALNTARHILRVRAWGFWDVEFVRKFDRAFTEKAEELQVSAKEWFALVDLTAFRPHSEEVQRMLREQLATAKKFGMKKLVYLGKKPMTQSQLKRLFLTGDTQKCSFVESEEEVGQRLLN